MRRMRPLCINVPCFYQLYARYYFCLFFLTAFYFKHYVMQPPVAESLSFIAPEKIEQSPLQDDNTIVEVFSYACHYCEVNESGVAELEKFTGGGQIGALAPQ